MAFLDYLPHELQVVRFHLRFSDKHLQEPLQAPHGLGAVVRHGLVLVAEREGHFPVTACVLVYALVHDLQEGAVLKGEAGLVVMPCGFEDTIGGALQGGIRDFELIRAGDQFIAFAFTFLPSPSVGGQTGQAGENVGWTAGEVETELATDGPAEG